MAKNTDPARAADAGYGAPNTVAEALGQVVWLLAQSPAHKELKIKDLEYTFMPAIVHEQVRVFRFGRLPAADPTELAKFPDLGAGRITQEGLETMPLGVAIWAKLSQAAEAKLERSERLTLADWKSGDRVWLVELISPFATKENRLTEIMLQDLMKGPFATTPFHLHRTDPTTGRREKITLTSHVAANSSVRAPN